MIGDYVHLFNPFENFMGISERTNKQNLKEELIQDLKTHDVEDISGTTIKQ